MSGIRRTSVTWPPETRRGDVGVLTVFDDATCRPVAIRDVPVGFARRGRWSAIAVATEHTPSSTTVELRYGETAVLGVLRRR